MQLIVNLILRIFLLFFLYCMLDMIVNVLFISLNEKVLIEMGTYSGMEQKIELRYYGFYFVFFFLPLLFSSLVYIFFTKRDGITKFFYWLIALTPVVYYFSMWKRYYFFK